MGQESVEALREVEIPAMLREPEPPQGLKDAWKKLGAFKQVFNMPPKEVRKAACQGNRFESSQVDLGNFRFGRLLPVMPVRSSLGG